MLRKMSIFFAVPLSLLLTASTVFLPETEETYFRSEEMIVIHESLDLLNLRIGYDYELKLHYITYTADFSEQDFYSKRLQLRRFPLQPRGVLRLSSRSGWLGHTGRKTVPTNLALHRMPRAMLCSANYPPGIRIGSRDHGIRAS